MIWMLSLGEDGMAKDYTLPADANIDGNNRVWEVDLFRK
jgi:hypothetical protein